jgi:hypothetical protein
MAEGPRTIRKRRATYENRETIGSVHLGREEKSYAGRPRKYGRCAAAIGEITLGYQEGEVEVHVRTWYLRELTETRVDGSARYEKAVLILRLKKGRKGPATPTLG